MLSFRLKGVDFAAFYVPQGTLNAAKRQLLSGNTNAGYDPFQIELTIF
jgi:hypothetical protein